MTCQPALYDVALWALTGFGLMVGIPLLVLLHRGDIQ